jgi:NAD(P)-dependent dehydrogenase (short-subunit alcohol dehydrogenase family)
VFGADLFEKKEGLRMDFGFEDKVVVVAGASKGIGLAVAKAFAEEGARVVAGSRC